MSILDRLVTVNIKLKDNYQVKWLVVVGTNQQEFIDAIEHIGGVDYLEENKVFAIFFDTTHPDKIATEMQDYKLVRKKYSRSYRVMSQAMCIGNVAEQDRSTFIQQCLKCWSDVPKVVWSNVELEG